MAQEHQEYIQTKVNPTLENLVTQVLLERPENPVPFMVKCLAEQTGKVPSKGLPQAGAGEAERLRNEVRALQEEVRALEAKLGRAAEAAPAPGGEGDEEEEYDDVEDLPPAAATAAYMKKGPRASVSAEAYGDWNQRQAFRPPVVPKSEEQRQRIMQVLRQSFLFSTLDQAGLDVLVGAMVERRAETGERVIQEGDNGDHMFVIEEGSFDCLKRIEGQEKVVKECTPGDFFGELALLYNCPRAASVASRGPGLLWQLDRGTFCHIVRDASVQKRELYDEFLAQVPLLEKLDRYDRSQLADALNREQVAAGTTVIKEGEEGAKFYLVEEGNLKVFKTNSVEEDGCFWVLNYGRGDHFGELALLRDELRAATVVAETECKLLWVDRKVFERLLGTLKECMKKQAAAYA